MTFIQSTTSHALIFKFGICIAVAFFLAGVLWLVFIYNHVVNFEDAIKRADAETKKIEVEKAELSDQRIALMGSEQMKEIVASERLVEEKTPEYLEMSRTWAAFASR